MTFLTNEFFMCVKTRAYLHLYNLHNIKIIEWSFIDSLENFPFHYQYHERNWKCATAIYNMPSKSLDHNYIKITSNKIEVDMDLQISADQCTCSLQSTKQDYKASRLLLVLFNLFDHVATYLTPWHFINGRTIIFAGGMKVYGVIPSPNQARSQGSILGWGDNRG